MPPTKLITINATVAAVADIPGQSGQKVLTFQPTGAADHGEWAVGTPAFAFAANVRNNIAQRFEPGTDVTITVETV